MSVTFATPVTGTSGSVSLTGVALGQPIIVMVDFGSSPSVSDTFAIPYTWTQVGVVSIAGSYGNVYKYCFIGTGGYGSSGTITVSGGSYVTAVSAIGASGAAGINAIDVYGSSSGNNTTVTSPSLTPTAANEGAVYSALAVDYTNFVFFNGGPSSPWSNTFFVFGGQQIGATATDPSPTSGTALSTTWSQSNVNAYPYTRYLSYGVILKVFSSIAPSAPTNTSPANASYDDVSSGYNFVGVYNPNDTTPQSAYALRIKLSGGSYGYWNGTDFSNTTVQWNTITTLPYQAFTVTVPNGVTVPGGTFSNGHTYNYSFASKNSSGTAGSFGSDLTFNAQAAPVTTVSAPAGTVHGTTQPTVSWSSTFPTGASQIAYQIIIESGSYGTTPGSGVTAWNSGVVTSTNLSVIVATALSVNVNYRVFVQVTETGNEVGTWAYNTFTLQVDVPAAPTVTAVAINDPTTGLPEVQLTIQGNDNFLTLNQSSLESDVVTGWAAGSNTTIAASNVWAQDGTYSLALTATANGSVTATTPTGTSGIAVVPGETLQILASAHSPSTPRACTVSIAFYNSSGTLISTLTSAVVNSTTSGNGGQPFTSVTAPAGAAYAALIITAAGLSASEVIYFDQMLLSPGNSGVWTAGGFVGSTTVTVLRSDGAYVRGAGWNGTVLHLPLSQTVVIEDFEAAPGTAYTYTAVVVSNSLSSATSAPSASATTNANKLAWLVDPLNPSGAVGFAMSANWQPLIHEAGMTYYPLGAKTASKSTDGSKGIGGTIPIFTSSVAQDNLVQALIETTDVLCLLTPARGVFYVMHDPSQDTRGAIPFSWEATTTPNNQWNFMTLGAQRP